MNISLSGICIDAGKEARVARLWSDVKVILKGDRTPEFTLPGKVMWISPRNHIGIKFADGNGKQGLIQEFIVEKSPLAELIGKV